MAWLMMLMDFHYMTTVHVLQELRAYLVSKLDTLTRNFQHDVSVCGVATWLLQLHLQDLHLAQLRAGAAPAEAASEPDSIQAHICSFLLKHRESLESRIVLEMLAQHSAPTLLLYAFELYGLHVQAFQVAVRGMHSCLHITCNVYRYICAHIR